MCCLFGIADRNGLFNGKERSRILSVLVTKCEVKKRLSLHIKSEAQQGMSCCALFRFWGNYIFIAR